MIGGSWGSALSHMCVVVLPPLPPTGPQSQACVGGSGNRLVHPPPHTHRNGGPKQRLWWTLIQGKAREGQRQWRSANRRRRLQTRPTNPRRHAKAPPPPHRAPVTGLCGGGVSKGLAPPAPARPSRPPPLPTRLPDCQGRIGTGGGTPPPLQSVQPMPSHCPPDAKRQPQWHL